MQEIRNIILNSKIKNIANKVFANERISESEALTLFNYNELSQIGYLADYANRRKSSNKVYYNKNIHIEPTNICSSSCKFCSFARKEGDKGAWFYTVDEMIQMIEDKSDSITEVHIVGGLHKTLNLDYYKSLFKLIKTKYPSIIIKALTAEEIHYISKITRTRTYDVLSQLIEAGMQTMPGGGAEIFSPRVRTQICDAKLTGEEWLAIHQQAHELGLDTNATMLYGHIENYEDRIDHMNSLRKLQDVTGGFNAFIPLKYKSKNNSLLDTETSVIDDFKTYSIARIFLDNFPHLKAYWPMMGKENSELLLNYGVDDIDGTIEDSTKIYSMAGSDEQKPTLTVDEIKAIATKNNKLAVERDSFYNEI
jgi:aminodeoxyfutalosine synthase